MTLPVVWILRMVFVMHRCYKGVWMLYIGSLLIIEQTIATVCSKYQNIYPFHCVLIKSTRF